MFCAQTFRQLLIAFSLAVFSISDGFIFGQMSGMMESLSSKDADVKSLTDDDLSWMASSINILCVLGLVSMGTITAALGRKKAGTIVSLPITASWVLIYFARDKTLFYVARVIQGVCYGGILVLLFISIGEYQPPKIRALSVTLIASVGSLVGSTLGHVLSLLMNWRNVALIGVIPSGLSMILPLFWVESPSWLASKGRFKESEEAFNALHPPSEASEHELRLLIASEKTKLTQMTMNAPKVFVGEKIAMAVKQTYFWKLFLFGVIIVTCKTATGRVFFSTLAITILQDITGTSDILFFTLVVDGFSILGAVISCFFFTKFNIRGLFFITSVIANVILVTLGMCLYMFPDNDTYLSWTKVSLFGLYFVTIMAGPYPVLDALTAEIFPIEIKSFYIASLGMIAGGLQFLSIKLAPNMLPVMGYHGIFFLNASIMFVCLVYMWFYMPETRGRSLQEIEYYFKNNTFNYNKELFKAEQTNELMLINSNLGKHNLLLNFTV